MSCWGKWILAAGIAGFGTNSLAKQISAQSSKKQTRQVVMRVNTRTNVIEVKTPRGWVVTRQVNSENENTQQEVTTEPVGWWGYRGWYGGGWAGGWGGYYNDWYPSYGYGGYNSPDSTYYIAPFYSGISTSYWNAYPNSYYFYTPTYTLYYGRTAYDPVNWFSSGLYNYYYYNI